LPQQPGLSELLPRRPEQDFVDVDIGLLDREADGPRERLNRDRKVLVELLDTGG
jgi:hypothetical protein